MTLIISDVAGSVKLTCHSFALTKLSLHERLSHFSRLSARVCIRAECGLPKAGNCSCIFILCATFLSSVSCIHFIHFHSFATLHEFCDRNDYLSHLEPRNLLMLCHARASAYDTLISYGYVKIIFNVSI